MKALARWLLLLAVALVALQLFFILRIALMAVIAPESTSFQRSEAWRIANEGKHGLRWSQRWVPYARISDNLKRAVLASEDDGFASHLFLSGERTLVRKGQEIVLTFALEMLLSKERILEIYLNSVEWGEGVFGAEAAARHYYRKSASQLTPYEAARLAVMLPRPRYFEKLPNSSYLSGRASVIVGRMPSAELP